MDQKKALKAADQSDEISFLDKGLQEKENLENNFLQVEHRRLEIIKLFLMKKIKIKIPRKSSQRPQTLINQENQELVLKIVRKTLEKSMVCKSFQKHSDKTRLANSHSSRSFSHSGDQY